MYKVIKFFTDMQDNDRSYEVGDTYPRKGLVPDKSRIAALLGSDNNQGVPVIEQDVKKPVGKGNKKAEDEISAE